MEKKLKQLFDYQKFEGNKRLDEMLRAAECRNFAELSDDELELAAGGRSQETELLKGSKP